MALSSNDLDQLLKLYKASKSEVILAGIEPDHIEAVAIGASVIEWLRSQGSIGSPALVESTMVPDITETFAEWAMDYQIENHYDRFMAIALYFLETQGLEAITTNDISRMYAKARWQKPKNLADVFAKASEKLYFTDVEEESNDGLKLWKLTRTGYAYFRSRKSLSD